MKRKVIALTGGIGSGKSVVAQFLREMGYQTVDCDALAKEIADESEVIAAVESLLGHECVSNGSINRAKVRETVFTDGNLLKKYDEIFFGRVRQRLDEIVKQSFATVFVEIPIIDAFDFHFDEIWLVDCSKGTRIARVTERDGVSAENVEHIMNMQHYNRYTRVIPNDGSVENLRQQVLLALKNAQIV
ncbi:MAG: dephospho-CoA kinase [Clostridiales bacterium]|nr:dephospho-CoA kinase [Clostridiales bacterium]